VSLNAGWFSYQARLSVIHTKPEGEKKKKEKKKRKGEERESKVCIKHGAGSHSTAV
jgi:hypothetical protein